MDTWQPIAEEYISAFENYKITLDHSSSIVKSYSITVISILFLISIKSFIETDTVISSNIKYWCLSITIFLFIYGVMVTVALKKITTATQGNIKRMNFLRRILLNNLSDFDYEEYISVCGFSENDSKNNWGITTYNYIVKAIVLLSALSATWVLTW